MATSSFIAIIEQHAEEAAFLWMLHSQAVQSANQNPEHLNKLAERIDAHIKGLILAGEDGWNCCMQGLEAYGEAGEVFAASILALNGERKDRLETVLKAVEAAPETAYGMISALGWHSSDTAKPAAY